MCCRNLPNNQHGVHGLGGPALQEDLLHGGLDRQDVRQDDRQDVRQDVRQDNLQYDQLEGRLEGRQDGLLEGRQDDLQENQLSTKQVNFLLLSLQMTAEPVIIKVLYILYVKIFIRNSVFFY